MAPKAYGVAFTPEAKEDLAIIRGGDLALTSSTRAATRYTELVMGGYELATFPERFERLPPALTAGRHIRRRPIGHHLLVYRIDEDEDRVVILGYFDSRRAPWRLQTMVDARGSTKP